MIVGQFTDETLAALLACESSPLGLTVCGSRWFGDARPDSDYDFVVEQSALPSEHLLPDGFTKRWDATREHYCDENTVTVYHRSQVQIIVVVSLQKRLHAREHIKTNRLNRKDTRVWDEYYKSHDENGSLLLPEP